MPTHHFTLIVDGADLQDESVVNSLFESGCDDAQVGCTDGVQFIDFNRDAASLDAAVLSAVADAERVDGIRVLRVAGLLADLETIKFVDGLEERPCGDIFNPWYESDENYEAANAPETRRDQLIHYLTARRGHARILMIAEAAGFQGARFTGIAMTSERILLGHLGSRGVMPHDVLPGLTPCRTSASSMAPSKEAQRKGFAEPTATTVWTTMREQGVPSLEFVLWNAVPWHPYDASKGRLTNRSPTDSEREAGRLHLERFIALYPRARRIAVGDVADELLSDLGGAHGHVRHPANGGVRKFKDGMARIVREERALRPWAESMLGDALNRIITDCQQCGGHPCIRETGIRVADVLRLHRDGSSRRDILNAMPALEPEDIRACLQFARLT